MTFKDKDGGAKDVKYEWKVLGVVVIRAMVIAHGNASLSLFYKEQQHSTVQAVTVQCRCVEEKDKLGLPWWTIW